MSLSWKRPRCCSCCDWRWRRGVMTLSCVLLLSGLPPASSAKETEQQIIKKIIAVQTTRILQARRECQAAIAATPKPSDGIYCEAIFDDIQCWNYTKAGTIAKMPCPAFIVNFNPNELSTRVCLDNGTWGSMPANLTGNTTSTQHRGWTNYLACPVQPTRPVMPRFVPGLIKEHMPRITLISKVGYSISLFCLVVATAIMIKFKRLHCQRNVIHINLFVTFMLRAVICLLRDSLLVQGLGLPQDIQYNQGGDIEFSPHGPHWECKLLFTLFQWALSANYMWIFVEGLYLHTLIFFAVFDQKAVFKWYIIIGWVTPFAFLIPWILTRIFYNNTLCWNTHEQGYYWILNGFIIATICVNFFFFLNIIRALYTKLRRTSFGDSQRYKKLAKSTLVLIPLFGVYYIFFIVITNHNHGDHRLTVGIMYSEMTLNSFQGTVVAVLFCFTNGEVRAELVKKWQRHRLRRQSVASLRSSRAMSTTSFFLGSRGDRPSICSTAAARRGSKFPNVDSCLSLRSMEAAGANLANGFGSPEAGGRAGSSTPGVRFPATQSSPSLRGVGELNGHAVAVVGPERHGNGDNRLRVPRESGSSFPPATPPPLSAASASPSPAPPLPAVPPNSCRGGIKQVVVRDSADAAPGETAGGTSTASGVMPVAGSSHSLCSMDSCGSGLAMTVDCGSAAAARCSCATPASRTAAGGGKEGEIAGFAAQDSQTPPTLPRTRRSAETIGVDRQLSPGGHKETNGLVRSSGGSHLTQHRCRGKASDDAGVYTETTPMLQDETFSL